jgi:hypothetical protein
MVELGDNRTGYSACCGLLGMTDLLEVREEGDFVISGTVSRDELEAELTPLNQRSLFDRRLKTVLRDMLDEADGDEILVEALVRNADADQ